MTAWGKLPKEVVDELNRRYWQNIGKFKQLLKGNMPQKTIFPIVVPLKPPTSGKVIAQDTQSFQAFVKAWQAFEGDYPNLNIQWQTKNLGFLGEQKIPTKLIINDLPKLTEMLGQSATQRISSLQEKFQQLVQLGKTTDVQKRIFNNLISYLEMIEPLSDLQVIKLTKLLPQLKVAMGKGNYLRAINIEGIDTKFIENNLKVIEILAESLYSPTQQTIDNASIAEFDLLNWLRCEIKPKDWLFVRPLCEQSKTALANLPILKLSSQTLLSYELPAKNILVIENEMPCFMLPHLPNTIAVAGGGKNLTWLKAEWLKAKKVGYWGDIDSEGLAMLSDARRKCPNIQSIMMDKTTYDLYEGSRGDEPIFTKSVPEFLQKEETELFEFIAQQEINQRRLEQEFIAQDYMIAELHKWLLTNI